ncbi:hypothetical protein PhaeoP128_01407 [Phaeobacter gallaeciensis]|nr:hypothetical protein PhaeoP129_01407 [Phaeobacter gallaeciensis]ATF22153.1 hypothetical protein PhaeoP128_01407 [Phaeobacter gallaeciensis]
MQVLKSKECESERKWEKAYGCALPSDDVKYTW